MIKRIVFFLFLTSLAQLVNAQDLLIFKNGSEIKAKVLKVSDKEIEYKKFDYIDGPLYVVLKSELVLIKYENGTNEVMQTEAPSNNNTTTTNNSKTTTGIPKIETIGNEYYVNSMPLNLKNVIFVLRSSKDPEIIKMTKTAKVMKSVSSAVSIPGWILAGYGSVAILLGLESTSTTTSSSGYQQRKLSSSDVTIITAGGVMFLTGGAMLTTHYILKAKYKVQIRKAVELYNKKIATAE
jgi:hypothetical protein